jgi:hypothetical protein
LLCRVSSAGERPRREREKLADAQQSARAFAKNCTAKKNEIPLLQCVRNILEACLARAAKVVSLDKEDELVLRISAVRLERALVMRARALQRAERWEQWDRFVQLSRELFELEKELCQIRGYA